MDRCKKTTNLIQSLIWFQQTQYSFPLFFIHLVEKNLQLSNALYYLISLDKKLKNFTYSKKGFSSFDSPGLKCWSDEELSRYLLFGTEVIIIINWIMASYSGKKCCNWKVSRKIWLAHPINCSRSAISIVEKPSTNMKRRYDQYWKSCLYLSVIIRTATIIWTHDSLERSLKEKKYTYF